MSDNLGFLNLYDFDQRLTLDIKQQDGAESESVCLCVFDDSMEG